MITAVLFWIFLLCCAAMFIIYGQMIERVFITFVFAAVCVTFIGYQYSGMGNISAIVIASDILLLAACLVILVISDRYWPIWFAGFHSNTIATHAAALLFPDMVPSLFLNLAGAWALPALGTSAYGVVLDYRTRQSSTAGVAPGMRSIDTPGV